MTWSGLILIPLVCIIGCVSVRDYGPAQDRSGLFRARHKSSDFKSPIPEEVLRDDDRHLVTNAVDAERVMSHFDSTQDIVKNSREDKCSVRTLYPAKIHQYRAQALLARKDFSAALAELNLAEAVCADLYLITPQDYLKATALAGANDVAGARAAASRFLDYGAAVTPARFTQFEAHSSGEVIAELECDQDVMAKYRLRAKAFLAGEGTLLWDEPTPTPKFYANNPFRPGGSHVGGWLVLPTTLYAGTYGTAFGGLGYYSWGERSVAASWVRSSSTGDYLGVRARQSIYETPNRDTDIDVFVGGRTAKRVEKYDHPARLEVRGHSFDPIVGAGATYRLKPELGFASQLRLTANGIDHRVDFGQSLYAFYDLIEGLSVNAGWIENAPVVSLSVLFAQIGYNIRDRGMMVWLQNLSF